MERTDVALLDAQKEHERWLIEHLAREAGIKPEEIDAKAPFSRYGFDSVAVVTMVGDVGCGWGGLLGRLANGPGGVGKGVGLTLSAAQARYAAAINPPNVEIRMESWADHHPDGHYDAIISIGAFEHFARIDSTNEE